MNIRGIDTAEDCTNIASYLAKTGIKFVGKYMRPDRCNLHEIHTLKNSGLKILSIWEKGDPTSPEYFTTSRGYADGLDCVEYMRSIEQPTGSCVAFAVDYDASPHDIEGPIMEYAERFHSVVKAAGWLPIVYGSGLVCQRLVGDGYAHGGYLAQSVRWANHTQAYLEGICPLVQGSTYTIQGLQVDGVMCSNEAMLW